MIDVERVEVVEIQLNETDKIVIGPDKVTYLTGEYEIILLDDEIDVLVPGKVVTDEFEYDLPEDAVEFAREFYQKLKNKEDIVTEPN